MLLLPCPDTGRQPMNHIHWFYDKVLRKSKLSYLCLVALAFHGCPGSSAGSCERYFRGVSFVDDLKRCNQKVTTIQRLSFINRNKEMLPTADAMARWPAATSTTWLLRRPSATTRVPERDPGMTTTTPTRACASRSRRCSGVSTTVSTTSSDSARSA